MRVPLTVWHSAPASAIIFLEIWFVSASILEVLSEFKYGREWEDASKGSCVLEFSAKLGERQLKGVDVITLSADRSRIVEFEV